MHSFTSWFACLYVYAMDLRADYRWLRPLWPPATGWQSSRPSGKTGPEFQAIDWYESIEVHELCVGLWVKQNPGILGTLKIKPGLLVFRLLMVIPKVWAHPHMFNWEKYGGKLAAFSKVIKTYIEPCKQVLMDLEFFSPQGPEVGALVNKRMVLRCQWKIQAPSNPIPRGCLLLVQYALQEAPMVPESFGQCQPQQSSQIAQHCHVRMVGLYFWL